MTANFFAQGQIDINFKSRAFAMFSLSNISVGPVLYYNHAYSGFDEVIYGGGLEIGDRWTVGVDAGILSRSVRGVRGTGFAGALIFGLRPTQNFIIKFPLVFRSISSGELFSRVEASVLPQLGVRLVF